MEKYDAIKVAQKIREEIYSPSKIVNLYNYGVSGFKECDFNLEGVAVVSDLYLEAVWLYSGRTVMPSKGLAKIFDCFSRDFFNISMGFSPIVRNKDYEESILAEIRSTGFSNDLGGVFGRLNDKLRIVVPSKNQEAIKICKSISNQLDIPLEIGRKREIKTPAQCPAYK